MEVQAFSQALETALNLSGTFAFAVSGALLAVRKRFELVGSAMLVEITAVEAAIVVLA